MELFRISKSDKADKLLASGRQNRWNLNGQYVIYSASTRSLAALELVVHRNTVSAMDQYRMMVISVPDEEQLVNQVMKSELPVRWRSMVAYELLQKIGSEWYKKQRSLILKVPSAVIPMEYNMIINTEHPDFPGSVTLVRLEDFFWDSRLF